MSEPGETFTRPRVLVIEDSTDSREMLVHLLGHEGFAATGAADGIEGFETARRLVPDLIITDLQMPRMTGVDLIRQVRDDPATSNIPVLVMTAAGSGDAREAMDAGASAFVLKPLNIDSLIVLCRALIPPQPSSIRPLVLVVDDIADTRSALRLVLEDGGYRVLEASNGQEAVIQADRETPRVILLDLLMPEVDGFAAARSLRVIDHRASIIIIAVTELDAGEVEKRAAGVSFDAVLRKPVTPAELLETTARLLRGASEEPSTER
jgi:CheY-like chemotaxis protein